MVNEQTNPQENISENKNVKAKKNVEISPESQEERRLLTAFLLDRRDELIKERNERLYKIERDEILLRSGKTISRLEIKNLITSLMQDYESAFPNTNPFFKNMFRLHPKLMGLDYNSYKKPRLAGRLLTLLTYDRFGIEILPALLVFAQIDGFWITKCYKHLTKDGLDYLLKFRDEANKMMEKFEDGQWYEFYAQYEEHYRKQLRLFK